MQTTANPFDRLMYRILFIKPQVQTVVPTDVEKEQHNARNAENVFGLSLLFSGVRCILQYAVLPFVLPAIGIAGDAAAPISLVINLAAMVAIVFSLRRFWQIDYQYKWQYLFVAVVALVLLVAFTVLDLQVLLNL